MVLEETNEPRFDERPNQPQTSSQNWAGNLSSPPLDPLKTNQIKFETSAEGFTLVHRVQNAQIVHEIPWRDCTPNAALVRDRLSDMRKASTRLTVRDLYSSMATFEEGAQRPLTDEEVSAFAFYSAKKMQTISYYWKGAAIVGTLIWWRGRRTFKYPFWTIPKDPSAFDVFPNKSRPLFTGRTANRAWYAQRLGVYLGIAVPAGYFLGVSSGTMSQVLGIKSDSRTQTLVQQTQQNMRDRIAQGHPVAGRHGRTGPQGPPPPQRGPGPSPQPIQRGSENGYLTSSSSGAGQVPTDTSLLNDSQMRTRDRRQQPSTPYPDNATTQSTFDPNKFQPRDPYANQNTRDPYSSSFSSQDSSNRNDRDRYSSFGEANTSSSTSSSSSYFDWNDSKPSASDVDDASPTAGNERDPYLSSSSSNPQGGSTWDRLRNESLARQRGGYQQQPRSSPPPSPSSQQRPQQQQQQRRPPPYPNSNSQNEAARGGGGGDSFTFSPEDEEKSLAKQQAQREFDEMVERERKGEGGAGGGGGGGFWGRS